MKQQNSRRLSNFGCLVPHCSFVLICMLERSCLFGLVSVFGNSCILVVMSDTALKDLNTLPGSERKDGASSKGGVDVPCSGSLGENGQKRMDQNSASLVPSQVNGDGAVNGGAESGNAEVEYVESENLSDVEDVEYTVKTLVAGLDSKDWVLVCDSLNNVRRLSIFHKEAVLDMLGDMIPLIVKSLKNPRSAVCKTAIMTSADVFNAYSGHIVDSLDPLLVQLLLKSSQDKKFVCEAAERALVAMTASVSPTLLLPKLQPYLKNRNPRIRAKASMCFSRSVSQLGVEGIKAYGIDKLIQVAASQLSDQLPESREAARTLLLELQTVFEMTNDATPTKTEQAEFGSWEQFCQSKLSPLSAQAVLRVTNVPTRDGLVLGS